MNEYLPPVGWADVATKQDVDRLRVEVDLRFESFERRITATLHQELHAQTWRLVTVMSGLLAVFSGLITAVVKL